MDETMFNVMSIRSTGIFSNKTLVLFNFELSDKAACCVELTSGHSGPPGSDFQASEAASGLEHHV